MNYEGRKQVMLRVGRSWFNLIVQGEKRVELRPDSKHWAWLVGEAPPDVARFACGRETHLRKIDRIERVKVKAIMARDKRDQTRRYLLTIWAMAGDGAQTLPFRPGDHNIIEIELGFVMGLCPLCGGLMWRHFARDDGEPDDALDYFGCDKCEKIQGFFKVSRGRVPIK